METKPEKNHLFGGHNLGVSDRKAFSTENLAAVFDLVNDVYLLGNGKNFINVRARRIRDRGKLT